MYILEHTILPSTYNAYWFLKILFVGFRTFSEELVRDFYTAHLFVFLAQFQDDRKLENHFLDTSRTIPFATSRREFAVNVGGAVSERNLVVRVGYKILLISCIFHEYLLYSTKNLTTLDSLLQVPMW